MCWRKRVEECLQAKKMHEEMGRGKTGMPGLEDSHLEKARGPQDRRGEEFTVGRHRSSLSLEGKAKEGAGCWEVGSSSSTAHPWACLKLPVTPSSPLTFTVPNSRKEP